MRAPLKSLKDSRPPTARPVRRSMSRKASRRLINKHHQLEKKQRQAIVEGDMEAQVSLAGEIMKAGGLEQYQQASLQGQSTDRGGDSSRVLLHWLSAQIAVKTGRRRRLLEIGCLSTANACSSSGRFDMVQIDLKSREAGIVEQDFMQRPIPIGNSDKFDIISLSLVLNYIPEPEERGQMLLRTLSFLQEPEANNETSLFPALFIVLPRSCVEKSRYLTIDRLALLMTGLGYRLERSKRSQKLSYSLWVRTDKNIPRVQFPKLEINPGRVRNNFCITLIKSPSQLSKPSKTK